MDNFIGTLIFILPGLMLYFWLQSFGINPTVKHNPAEFTAISALLWFPVSLTSLLAFNGLVELFSWPKGLNAIWNIEGLKKTSGSFIFLCIFLGSSLIISFLFAAVWAKWVHQQLFMRFLINGVRKWRGLAPLSKSSTVWDEVFLNNDAQVVEIGKIDKEAPGIIGEIKKASRPFEPERNILLSEIDFFTDLVKRHQVPVSSIFIDTKSGMYIKIFDPEQIKKAQLKDLEIEATSS